MTELKLFVEIDRSTLSESARKLEESIKKGMSDAGGGFVSGAFGKTNKDPSGFFSQAGFAAGMGGTTGVLINQGVELLQKIVGFLSQMSPQLGGVLRMFQRAVNLFFRPFGDFLAEALRPIAQLLLPILRQWNTFWRGLFPTREARQKVGEALLTGGISTAGDVGFEAGKELFRLGESLNDILKPLTEVDLSEIFTGAIEGISDFGEWLSQFVDGSISNFGSWLNDFIIEPISNFGTWLSDFVVGSISDFGSWLSDFVSDSLTNFSDWLADFIITPIFSFSDWLAQFIINPVVDFGKWLFDMASGVFSGESVGDVLLRPGQSPIKFSPNDTIQATMSNHGGIGGGRQITIQNTFNGSQSDSDMSLAADTIVNELKARGVF